MSCFIAYPIIAFCVFLKRAPVHTNDRRVHDCIAAIEQWLAGDDSVDLAGTVDLAPLEHRGGRAAQAVKPAAFGSWKEVMQIAWPHPWADLAVEPADLIAAFPRTF